MRLLLYICVILGFQGIGAAPSQITPRDDLATLKAIKQRMTQNLARIPNYTCLETMARGRRPPERFIIAAHGKSVPFRGVDVVRLEVAEVRGGELYAHAGDHEFRKHDPSQLIGTGLIANGLFSLFTHDIFQTDIAVFQPRGEEEIEGRLALRFDFRVSRQQSGLLVGTEIGEVIVGYHGSFWADPRTMDADRLELAGDEVPPSTGLTAFSVRIDYSTVQIGSYEVLLPQSGEMTSRRTDGWDSHNQISFTHCREYGVQTTIHFDDVTAASDETTANVDLPAGLELTITLESAIDSWDAHVGDAIKARVDDDAKNKGVVVVPKGAMISGRIRSLARHSQGSARSIVELEWTQVEFAGKRARFFAELQKVAPAGAQRLRVTSETNPLPGVGKILGSGDRVRLPAGTRMVWKTTSY